MVAVEKSNHKRKLSRKTGHGAESTLHNLGGLADGEMDRSDTKLLDYIGVDKGVGAAGSTPKPG